MKKGRPGHQSFLEGAIVLTAATCIVKVIGALFKIPLANILGGVGMSYFVSAYDIFNPLYSLTVTGLGIALSRMVSEYASRGEYGKVREALRTAQKIFWALGLLGMAILVLAAPYFVQAISNPGALLSVYAIAPAVVFSCISAIYRGFYQGLSNMVPTAKSQVLEAAVKLLVGTAFSYGITIFMRTQYAATGQLLGQSFASPPEADIYIFRFAAAGAVLGVTLSTAAGALYISLRHRKLQEIPERRDPHRPAGLGRSLIRIAIPISLSTLVVNLSSLIDLTSVMNCLAAAIRRDAPVLMEMYHGLIPAEITADLLPEYLYGSYSGLAFSIFNLIPSLTAAMGISALPAVTRTWSSGSRRELEETVSSVLRISLLVALPAGFGISVLSGPILNFLYPARAMEAAIIAPVLRVMGISAILVAASTPINSILQAIGRERLPLLFLTMGAVIKLAANLILVSQPEINIQGVPYGTLLCYFFIVVASTASLVKFSGICLDFWKVLVKPIFCAIVAALTAYSSYYLLLEELSSTLRIVSSIGLTASIYGIMILLTRTITASDVQMLPVSENVVKTLEKLGVIS